MKNDVQSRPIWVKAQSIRLTMIGTMDKFVHTDATSRWTAHLIRKGHYTLTQYSPEGETHATSYTHLSRLRSAMHDISVLWVCAIATDEQ